MQIFSHLEIFPVAVGAQLRCFFRCQSRPTRLKPSQLPPIGRPTGVRTGLYLTISIPFVRAHHMGHIATNDSCCAIHTQRLVVGGTAQFLRNPFVIRKLAYVAADCVRSRFHRTFVDSQCKIYQQRN